MTVRCEFCDVRCGMWERRPRRERMRKNTVYSYRGEDAAPTNEDAAPTNEDAAPTIFPDFYGRKLATQVTQQTQVTQATQ